MHCASRDVPGAKFPNFPENMHFALWTNAISFSVGSTPSGPRTIHLKNCKVLTCRQIGRTLMNHNILFIFCLEEAFSTFSPS